MEGMPRVIGAFILKVVPKITTSFLVLNKFLHFFIFIFIF